MEFEDLAKVWRDEETGELRRTRVESLSDLQTRATRAEARARRRFRRAAIIWLVMVPWFGFWAVLGVLTGSPLFAIGCTLLAVGCTAPVVYFRRMSRRETDATLSVRETLAREIARLRALRRAIRRMIDWVMGSLVVGGPMIALGARPFWSGALVLSALFVLVGLAGRGAWRRFADNTKKTSAELESWLVDLETV